MELCRGRIVRVLHTETQMKYEMKWKYMLAKTRYPGVYKHQKGGFVVRSRPRDPSGKVVEILRPIMVETELQALQFLESEKDRIRTGTPKQQNKLLSVYAVELLDRKVARRDIKSKAGESKWRVSLTHLIGGLHKKGFERVQGLGDYPITVIRALHVQRLEVAAALLVTGGV